MEAFKEYKEWKVVLLLIIIAFFSQLIFAISVSPLSAYEGGDSCIFRQMALALLQGKTLYIDIFDHKGPVLYFINALGLLISSNKWGIFILMVLNCFVTLYLWYLIASHYIEGWKRILPVLLTLVIYISAMEEGNLTEDWSLIPLSYTLYLVSRYLTKNKQVSVWEFFLVGVGAGLITFMRMNNMALTCCVVVFFIVDYIRQKSYVRLFRSLCGLMGGGLMVALFCVGAFYYIGGGEAVSQMMYGTFWFNMFEYSNWGSYYEFLVSNSYNHWFFFVTVIVCYYAYLYDKSHLTYFVFFVLSFLFCYLTMGRNGFLHYMITVVPLFAMCCAYTFRSRTNSYILLILMFLLANESYYRRQLPYTIGETNRAWEAFYRQTDSIVQNMSDIEKKSIWNYNASFDGSRILQRYHLTQCNRIILHHHMNFPNLRNGESNKLHYDMPLWILVNPQNPYYEMRDSIYISNNYKLVKNTSMAVKTKNTDINFHVLFYKRK